MAKNRAQTTMFKRRITCFIVSYQVTCISDTPPPTPMHIPQLPRRQCTRKFRTTGGRGAPAEAPFWGREGPRGWAHGEGKGIATFWGKHRSELAIIREIQTTQQT